MATSTGQFGAVYVGGAAVAEIRDWSLEESAEVVADTTMGDAWVTNKTTLKSWTSSFNAYWDASDAAQSSLTVGAEVTLALYPTGNSSTNTYWTGSAIITSVSKSASFDGLVEASFSATGNGALTESTVA